MSKTSLVERYNRILAEEAGREQPALPPGVAERRKAPRVSVGDVEMAVNLEYPVTPVNLSIGGAYFYSEQPFPVDSEIMVSVASVFSLTATVVDCTMEETDANLLEVRYHVRCRFADEQHGLQMLVLAKQIEARH